MYYWDSDELSEDDDDYDEQTTNYYHQANKYDDNVSTTLLGYSDNEYHEVKKLFCRGSSTKKFYLDLIAIEKVHSPVLLQKFEKKKYEYLETYGHVRIEKVFHGTKAANVPSILKNNFDVSQHGQNRGHRFGAGVSFSAFSNYSCHYCDELDSGDQMLLCLVLVSNIKSVPELRKRGPPLLKPPYLEDQYPLRYDTTAKNKETMDVIVKFDDHSFYPAFIIHFVKKPRDGNPNALPPLKKHQAVSNLPWAPQMKQIDGSPSDPPFSKLQARLQVDAPVKIISSDSRSLQTTELKFPLPQAQSQKLSEPSKLPPQPVDSIPTFQPSVRNSLRPDHGHRCLELSGKGTTCAVVQQVISLPKPNARVSTTPGDQHQINIPKSVRKSSSPPQDSSQSKAQRLDPNRRDMHAISATSKTRAPPARPAPPAISKICAPPALPAISKTHAPPAPLAISKTHAPPAPPAISKTPATPETPATCAREETVELGSRNLFYLLPVGCVVWAARIMRLINGFY